MYRCSDDVIVTDLAHELILLDPRKGQMYRLNETARRVWLGLPALRANDLASVLMSEFEVPPERACADVKALLLELTRAGLVEVESDR